MIDPRPALPPRAPRIAAALLSGALLAACFPPFGLSALAWVCLAPLLWALDGASPRQAAGRAWLAGLIAMGGVGWFTTSFGGNVLWMRLLPWALFSAIEALFFIPVGLALAAILRGGRPASILLGAPAAWVLGEWLRGAGAFGFPFGMLANALSGNIAVLQLASLGGWMAVSYAAALIATAVFLALTRRGAFMGTAMPAALALLAAITWGAWRAETPRRTDALSPGLRVVVAQGNTNVPWEAPGREEEFRRLSADTVRCAREGGKTDLIVWSESTLPGSVSEPRIRRAVAAAARAAGAPILTGSIVFAPDGAPMNVAVLALPDGRIAGQYQKRRLVPFGEWVPLRRVLPLLNSFGVVERDEVPGSEWTVLRDGPMALGVPICFESASSEASRAFALAGANLIAVITNDGWFGRTGMAEQHAAAAPLRAVETGRWVARCGHTGISGFVGPDGRWTGRLPLNRPGVLAGRVTLRSGTTPFVRYGDWFLFLCVGLLIGAVAFRPAPVVESAS
jgi:apolipoprotein N-acyltransferase